MGSGYGSFEGSKVAKCTDVCVHGTWQHEGIKMSGPDDESSLVCNSVTVFFETVLKYGTASVQRVFWGHPSLGSV